ncbi:MAG: succinyl-diaminopimelate desuccinylase [Pseudomonadota bacterium]
MPETDVVDLTRRLIRCPSVTPEEGGALTLLSGILTEGGFTCHRADRGGIANLYARWGKRGHAKTFGFNGHTDVVPTGDPALWASDPFAAEIREGKLWGRGAADMKSAVAAFTAAAIDFARTRPDGAIVLAITGDEEGDGVDGTAAILDWMTENKEALSVCLVGEPTCPEHLGDTIKIGRRGSMTTHITATGAQGHVAYPHRARNPVHAMATLMARLSAATLDKGTAHFDASSLQITSIDTGNPASNVIPAQTRATFNIRFNDSHTSESLIGWIKHQASLVQADTGVTFDIDTRVSGESFVTEPGPLSTLVSNAVAKETGVTPKLSTTGGTSDARFIKDHCPVVEFGLVGKTMHQVDEHVAVADIIALKRIYTTILRDYFA